MEFKLDKAEADAANNWMAKHIHGGCPILSDGAIGGRYTYCFTPTGLGDVIVIKCACGAEADLTDYSLW